MADSTVKLLWKTDRASLSETLRANNQVEKSLAEVAGAAKKSTPILDRLGKEGVESLRAVAKEADNATDALRKSERQAMDTGDALSSVKSGGGGLGDVGRLESVTSGAVGLSGISGLQPIGEAAGLVDSVGAAFSTMNPFVIASTVGIGALAISLRLLGDASEEAAIALGQDVAANRELAQLIASGATTEQVEKQLQSLTIEYEQQSKILETTQNNASQFNNVWSDVTKGLGLTGAAVIEETRKANEDQEKIVSDLASRLGVLKSAVEDGAFATNDAAIAEDELAQAREQAAQVAAQAAVADAAAAGELARVRAESKSLYSEDIANRLQANTLRKTQLDAELAALKATGDTSEIVTDRIQALQRELGNLGETTQVLKAAAKTAPSREAERERDKARQEAERAADQAAQQQEQQAQRALDIQKNTQNKLADLQTKFARDEEQARIDMYDKLEDIRRKAIIDEGKAAEQRDFLQLADTRDAAKEEARALERENERAARDRLRELQYANTDVMLEQRRAVQDLQATTSRKVAIEKQGMQATLNFATDMVKALERLFSGSPIATGGRAGSSSGGLQDLAAVL